MDKTTRYLRWSATTAAYVCFGCGLVISAMGDTENGFRPTVVGLLLLIWLRVDTNKAE